MRALARARACSPGGRRRAAAPLSRASPPGSTPTALALTPPHTHTQHTDITIGGQPAGRLRMELWKDVVPKTGAFNPTSSVNSPF
jgi:hypothetical protein